MKRFLLLSLVLPAVASGATTVLATDPPHAAAGLQRLARLEAPPRHGHAGVDASASVQGANPCLTLLPTDPAGAADDARDWSRHGGGDPAAQCAALADVALGNPEAGAASLDLLAQQARIAANQRAVLADEASQAWLAAARPDRALASAALAVSLDPHAPALLTDRARAALAAGRAEQAVADLSQVLATHPGQAEALVVRATAYRKLDRIDAARADIDAACTVLPDEPEALLERGILRERLGDLDGARSDWSRILSVSPDTPEADLAQQDLALLDAGPEAR
jgi:tetratricopeptide (TPR) repeat protein